MVRIGGKGMSNLEKALLIMDIFLVIWGFYGYFTTFNYMNGVCFGFGLCSLLYSNWKIEEINK